MAKAYFPSQSLRLVSRLNLDWLKTNAGTNIEPQNKMYLSVSGMHSESVK